MSISAETFTKSIRDRATVSILVGVNGAGKSRFLVDLSYEFLRQKRQVYVICNTPFDRFIGRKKIIRISQSSGRSLPERLFKRAIAKTETLNSGFNRVLATLEYCGFEPSFTVEISPGPLIQVLKNPRFNFGVSDDVEVRELIEEYFLSLDKRPPELKNSEYEQLVHLLGFIRSARFDRSRTYRAGGSLLEQSGDRDRANVIKFEALLKKVRAIDDISIWVKRGGEWLNLLQGSSGELALISTFVFLATELRSGAVLLIDEPENSLHPKWQREYVTRLRDITSFLDATIVVSTHSPIIVQGAKSDRDTVDVYSVFEGKIDRISYSHASQSIEETLWDAFSTVTPKNHFVSEKLAEKLQELAGKSISLEQFEQYVSELKANSFDTKQREFLDASMQLALEVDGGSNDINRDD